MRVQGLPLWLSLCGGGRVHWVQACKRSGFVLAFVVCSVSFSLPLSALLLCLWWVACKYAFISHSKGVFKGFYGVRVTLVLCVDCVAFVCVRCLAVLGLVACLPSFCPFFFFVLPCLLSCSLSCFLGFVGWLLALFPFGWTGYKKGRNSLRPLLVCCVLVIGLEIVPLFAAVHRSNVVFLYR